VAVVGAASGVTSELCRRLPRGGVGPTRVRARLPARVFSDAAVTAAVVGFAWAVGGCGALDGFVTVNSVSAVLGLAWFFLFRHRVAELETLKQREWVTKSGRVWLGRRTLAA
jgi:hypothetical protein